MLNKFFDSNTEDIASSVNFINRMMKKFGWLPDVSDPKIQKEEQNLKIPFYFKILYWIHISVLISLVTAGMILTIVSLFDPQMLKGKLFATPNEIVQINTSWGFIFDILAMIGSIPITAFIYYVFYRLTFPKRIRDYFDEKGFAITSARSKGGDEEEIEERAIEFETEIHKNVDIDKVNEQMKPVIKIFAIIAIVGLFCYFASLIDYVKINGKAIITRSLFTLTERKFVYDKSSKLELTYTINNYRSSTKDGYSSGFYPELIFHTSANEKILLWDFNRTQLETERLLQIVKSMKKKGVKTESLKINFYPDPNIQYLEMISDYQKIYSDFENL